MLISYQRQVSGDIASSYLCVSKCRILRNTNKKVSLFSLRIQISTTPLSSSSSCHCNVVNVGEYNLEVEVLKKLESNFYAAI